MSKNKKQSISEEKRKKGENQQVLETGKKTKHVLRSSIFFQILDKPTGSN